MRAKGITYDTGFLNGRSSTRATFEPDVVRREMEVIRDDLHCTAVRVTGGDPERLELAARCAADAGLEVWFCPFTCDLTIGELHDLLLDCAERAERVRRQGAEVVFVCGSELSLFTSGFLPGDTLGERLALLASPDQLRTALAQVPGRLNAFFATLVPQVRERFGGRVTYACLPFEGVDWTPFDIVATDAGYRSAELADRYREQIARWVAAARAHAKPAAITELGCTTHRGAADLGGRGDELIEWDADSGRPVGLRAEVARDEDEQAAVIRELLAVAAEEGVDSVFVNTFARYDLPHRPDPRADLDRASYGVVKVLEDRRGATYPDLPWEPKAAFAVLAEVYGA